MKYIRLITPKNKAASVKNVQIVITQAIYNPLNSVIFNGWQKTDIVPDKKVFKSEKEALNAQLEALQYDGTNTVRWQSTGENREFFARILTNGLGKAVTEDDITFWKKGQLKLYMKDVFVTLN